MCSVNDAPLGIVLYTGFVHMGVSRSSSSIYYAHNHRYTASVSGTGLSEQKLKIAVIVLILIQIVGLSFETLSLYKQQRNGHWKHAWMCTFIRHRSILSHCSSHGEMFVKKEHDVHYTCGLIGITLCVPAGLKFRKLKWNNKLFVLHKYLVVIGLYRWYHGADQHDCTCHLVEFIGLLHMSDNHLTWIHIDFITDLNV